MAKELELSYYGAIKRLMLFLKLRKGKAITEKTIKDFNRLINNKMYANFKDHASSTISKHQKSRSDNVERALRAIKSQFIKWEDGGNCRLCDIENFAFYEDQKYKATIKGELEEISKDDFEVLEIIYYY